MRIRCPHCGERDSREFSYLGDAAPRRPDGADEAAMVAYAYPRANPAGPLEELWQHTPCRTWLRVTRDTRTHAILAPGGTSSGASGAASGGERAP